MSTPSTDGETLYIGASDETLYALDVASGTPEWTYETEDMVWSSPALAFETLYFVDWNGLVYALDVGSGEELWSTDTVSDYISGSVAVDENALYIGNTPYNSLDDPSPNYGTMFKLDRTDGREYATRGLWRYRPHDIRCPWTRSLSLLVDKYIRVSRR